MATRTALHDDLEKPQFWSERCYARRSVNMPLHVARRVGASKTTPIRNIVGELLRRAGYCNHLEHPKPPIKIWGAELESIEGFVGRLSDASNRQTVPRVRRGKTEHTKQKITTPTLMACIASWPTEGEPPEAERIRWEGLVIQACRKRFGDRLAAVVAHVDEPHYHLHILVHNHGASVKPLQMGHALAAEWKEHGDLTGGDLEDAGDAYRAGAATSQDWYWSEVAQEMGWARKSAAPRPRVPRAQLLLERKAKLDADETALIERLNKLKAAEEELQRATEDLQRADEEIKRRETEIGDRIDAIVQIEAEQIYMEASAEMMDDLMGVRPKAPKPKSLLAKIMRR